MENFEVFISFKNTDKHGELTEDYAIAKKLYEGLTDRKISTFYSNISLVKLGESLYKRSIDAALDTTQILIVISTQVEYIESRWIKYEWESFHTDILNGMKKDAEIITYTRNILPIELPRTLRSYQNFQIDNTDVSTLILFIENILQKIHSKVSNNIPVSTNTTATIQSAVSVTNEFSQRFKKSAYSSSYSNEFSRLQIQAQNSAVSDKPAIQYIKEHMDISTPINVLDIGCAYGFVTADRFGNDDNVKNILGLDNNAAVIEQARQMHDNSKLHFEIVDVEAIDFEFQMNALLKKYNIEKFHIIFSALTLHHLKNPSKLLRKIRKFLDKEGYILLRGSDDGSKLSYPKSDIMEQIIQKSLSAPGVSDRLNGRKLYAQLVDSGYRNIRIFSHMRDLSQLDFDDRDNLFQESFAYRVDYFRKLYEKEPFNIQAKHDYEWMQDALEVFEQQFFEKDFWYCEYDYVAVAQK